MKSCDQDWNVIFVLGFIVYSGSSGVGRAEASDGPRSSLDSSALSTDFEETTVDPNPNKPAFISVKDFDGDGSKELIVSVFADSGPLGSGYVNIYHMIRPRDPSEWVKLVLPGSEGVKFPNSISSTDVDGDGDLDLILPSGFLACMPMACGGLNWFEQTAGGWRKHTIVSGSSRFYHHAEFVDLDGDGVKDIVTVGEKKSLFDNGSAAVHLFRGSRNADRFEKAPVYLAAGLGSFPTVLDLDGDGDLDMASAEYFGSQGSFFWIENVDGAWVRRLIDDQSGKSAQLSFVPGLGKVGKRYAVGSNHTNTADDRTDKESGVFLFEVPADPRQPWPKKSIATGIASRQSGWISKQGAPGVFAWGDIDGDGDVDIAVAGDGDARVFWLRQVSPLQFETRVVAGGFAQGGVAVEDLDGDGRDEIIASSYDANKLEIFRWVQ